MIVYLDTRARKSKPALRSVRDLSLQEVPRESTYSQYIFRSAIKGVVTTAIIGAALIYGVCKLYHAFSGTNLPSSKLELTAKN